MTKEIEALVKNLLGNHIEELLNDWLIDLDSIKCTEYYINDKPAMQFNIFHRTKYELTIAVQNSYKGTDLFTIYIIDQKSKWNRLVCEITSSVDNVFQHISNCEVFKNLRKAIDNEQK